MQQSYVEEFFYICQPSKGDVRNASFAIFRLIPNFQFVLPDICGPPIFLAIVYLRVYYLSYLSFTGFSPFNSNSGKIIKFSYPRKQNIKATHFLRYKIRFGINHQKKIKKK